MSGGGGSIPSAPNLSGNIANANNTFNTATSDAAQTMSTAQQYNQNAQSNLANVTGMANSQANNLASEANTNINQYNSTFSPLQAQEAQSAANYGSSANIQRLTGQAIGGTAAANAAAAANSKQALAAEGVDPGSIQGASMNRQAAVNAAGQESAAGTNAAIGAQQTAFGMENTANALGTQVGALGASNAASAANTSAQGQQSMNQTNSAGIQNLGAANQYLNTGINANNSAMTGSQDQFSDQMQVQAAQAAQANSTMSGIGSIVGAAAMFMESGGPVPGAIPTMDTGGNVTAQGAYRTPPIPGSTDTKPAMLTPGEFVMPKDVVDFKGQDYFHRQIDSIRQAKNKRMAIPVMHRPHVQVHA